MNRLLTMFCLLAFCTAGFAQVTESERVMSQGSKNALSLTLGKTDAESAMDSWEKFMKDYKGKTKVNKKTGEIFTDNAEMSGISSNTVDVYATVTQQGTDAILAVWYDMGGAFLQSGKHPAAYTNAKAMIEKFSLTVSTQALEMQMEVEEDVLKDYQKELKDLKGDEEDLREEIAKCEKKIEEAKAALETNSADQAAKEEAVKMQEDKVKEVKGKINGM